MSAEPGTNAQDPCRFAAPGRRDQSAPNGLDVLALGAIVTRLDPGVVPFRKASRYDVHVAGGEFNVVANLADCFGLRTAIATAMVDYPIGAFVRERIRAVGVEGIYRTFSHDGASGPNIATVYSDRGHGGRPPVVFYNRANEAAAQLRPGDFDWPAIFGRGIRWFHSGGIFASLAPTTPDLIVEAMTAARAAGATISCDLNYRQKLWASKGGAQAARTILCRIVEHVDVLLCNEEDLQLGLGIPGPDVERASGLEPDTFLAMIGALTARFPNIQSAATTLREVQSASRHRWSAVAWERGRTGIAPVSDVDVLDRVGGGDGFAAGFIYGLLAGASVTDAVQLGWAHGALVATTPGDTTMVTVTDARRFAEGGSARIER
jgi:2-dehydro-3-deoxygluconokinase